MEMNSQLHPPAAILQLNEPPVPIKRMTGTQSPSEQGGELKISVPSGNGMAVFHLIANRLTKSPIFIE
jgi:hypothetical protein